jgi:acyl-[acyl-carrier-protein]-phospholipid O-acyltransferase/long-chain-fatty-acid--[acyl-carrier-protein] ligase
MFVHILRFIVKTLFRVSLSGAHDQQFSNRTVFVANHSSLLDGVLLALFLPAKVTVLVHTSVLDNIFFRFLLRGIDHYAADPTNPLALKNIIRILENDKSVLIFPEGRVTLTGGLMKVYDGAAFIAARTNADVVAINIEGASLSYLSYLEGDFPKRLFPKITLHFLDARKIVMPVVGAAKVRRRAVGEEMRRILQEMVYAAHSNETLFDGFMDALERHGRSHKIAEDIGVASKIDPKTGNSVEMKTFVNQSYGQILKTILAVQRMSDKFSSPGDRVGVLLPNSTGTASVIFGLSSAARVPALLNYTAGAEGMQNALIASDTRVIISSRRFLRLAKLESVVARLQNVTIHYLEDLKEQFGTRDKLWLVGYALWAPRKTGIRVRPEDPAVVIFTSGSEGKPKGVVHTHASLRANIAQVCAVADFSPADKFFVCLPLFHSFGLTAGMLLPLINGSRVFFYPTPLHYRIIPEIIYDKRATVLFGTSTFLGNYGRFAHPFDLMSLRYVVAGAEKLSDAVRSTWVDKFGIRIMEGYGITECAPVIAVNTPMAYKRGTVGTLMPGLQYKLEPVPGITEGGLLHVKGPNIMAGYLLYDNPGKLSAHESSMGPGWYNTGDIVTVDAEGFVEIRGRAKRFAKLAGEMVSLEVVEQIARAASPQFAHASVSRPDPAKGEMVILYTTDPELTRERLSLKAKELGHPEIAVSRNIRVIDAIPVLGTGKTDYVSLNALAASQQ